MNSKVCFGLFALMLAFSLKFYYANASSDDLNWILKPTAFIVESGTDLTFVHEQGTGYIDKTQGIIIAPVCSGVNFLIVSFCMAIFTGLSVINSIAKKAAWLFFSAVSAYLITVLVNSLRIVASIRSISIGNLITEIPAGILHKLDGILIFFSMLCVYHFLMTKLLNNSITKSQVFVPALWYTVMMVMIPLVNLMFRDSSAGFTSHCFLVISVSISIGFLYLMIVLLKVLEVKSLLILFRKKFPAIVSD